MKYNFICLLWNRMYSKTRLFVKVKDPLFRLNIIIADMVKNWKHLRTSIQSTYGQFYQIWSSAHKLHHHHSSTYLVLFICTYIYRTHGFYHVSFYLSLFFLTPTLIKIHMDSETIYIPSSLYMKFNLLH